MESHNVRPSRTVSIELLKAFARDKLPVDSPLRDLILAEPDRILASELAVKIPMYLQLLRRLDQGSGDC